MEPQAAHAECVPFAQLSGATRVSVMAMPRSRCGARQRIEHDAVVVAVRVALHHQASREAELVEQREVASSGASGGV